MIYINVKTCVIFFCWHCCFTLCAYFVHYASVIVVIKESYYCYRHCHCHRHHHHHHYYIAIIAALAITMHFNGLETPKIAHFLRGFRLQSNKLILGSTWVYNPNGIQIGLSFLCRVHCCQCCDQQTATQTLRQTDPHNSTAVARGSIACYFTTYGRPILVVTLRLHT